MHIAGFALILMVFSVLQAPLSLRRSDIAMDYVPDLMLQRYGQITTSSNQPHHSLF